MKNLIITIFIALLFFQCKNSEKEQAMFNEISASLVVSSEIIKSKNEQLYSEFEKGMYENPRRVMPWKMKADELKQKTDEVIVFIDRLLKIGIDNNEKDLVKKISGLKDFYISMNDRHKELQDTISTTLNILTNTTFNDKTSQKILLAKARLDIRNCEWLVLNYLLSNIEAPSFRFNKIEAVVNAKSSYVFQGDKYEAEVFLVTTDTTQCPKIVVGDSELPIRNGKGIYRSTAVKLGNYTFEGKVMIKSPYTAEIMAFPFKAEYTVGKRATKQ